MFSASMALDSLENPVTMMTGKFERRRLALVGGDGGCTRHSRPSALAVEPGFNVPFSEPPLATHPNGGNFASFDQPVNRT
jgi:hypothetical protein